MATRGRSTSRVLRRPAELIDEQAEALRKLRAGTVVAHQVFADGLEADYFELTGGKVTRRELRRMGHPFAKTGTRGRQRRRLDRLPINRQTGRLQKSIRQRRLGFGAETRWEIGFDRSKAGRSLYVLSRGGTKRMVPRGFEAEIAKRGKARHLATKRYLQGRL